MDIGGNQFWAELSHNALNFCLGGVAGAFGASTVYPIDLIKTRMQNQRKTSQLLYKNNLDCAKQILRNEGVLGFYRGCGVQALGIAPGRAIKFSTNNFVRDWGTDLHTGKITLLWEIIAGGIAGAVHVIPANPQEIVKIRMQVQGEIAALEGTKRPSAIQIIRQLGPFGLYKGAASCLLRDIPFAAMYFPAFAHFKKDLFHEGVNGKKLSFGETLASASMASIPSCWLVTPADFIKTRLQVKERAGQVRYKGTIDACKTIFREEGYKVFFTGSVGRILRSSPQYGFALAAYEYLQTAFANSSRVQEKDE